jgi:hypothetical protein
MQARSRDRHSDHGCGVTSKRQPAAALFALPLVRQRNPRLLAHAIVAEGSAVAAADHELRPGDLRAESRLSRAGAADVGDEALSGLMLTEQAGVTFVRGENKTAALFADPDRASAGGD